MYSGERTAHQIEAIFFDMNGTLRRRVPDEAWQQQSHERLLTILGKQNAPAAYFDELTRRYQTYTKWADENEISLTESEIWTRWITPELPQELIKPQAVELMLAFRNRNGRSALIPGAAPVIAELHRRGYRLGVISNTTSSVDLPRFIEGSELGMFFEVVLLSATCGIRKPNPSIFREAARIMQVNPARCAYLGNKPAYDVVGPRRAGFGLAMIINSGKLGGAEGEEPNRMPDFFIHELSELLQIFPPCCG